MEARITHHQVPIVTVAESPTLVDLPDFGALSVARTLQRQLQALASELTLTLRRHLSLNQVYLLPLRLFIGIGWLRACAEKLLNPNWLDGTALTTFLNEHVAQGSVVFPTYHALVTNVFLPHAAILSWFVILGQLLAGIAILSGSFTNAALLGGLFMNVNFLLIGEPNPSAFYIVIQAALLIANAGVVFGMDARLSQTHTNPLLCAQPPNRICSWLSRRVVASGVLASLAVAVYGYDHVTDFSPGGSIADPAMILMIMAMLSAAWFAIGFLRMLVLDPADDPPPNVVPRARLSDHQPEFRRLAHPRAAGGAGYIGDGSERHPR